MKVQVSHRLDGELVEWATGYAARMSTPEKRITRSAVIEGGLKRLRELADGGAVPELESEPQPKSVATGRAALSGRQVQALRGRG